MSRAPFPASRRQSVRPAAGGGLITGKKLIAWMNQRLGADYKDFNELASGVGYCKILDLLRPGTVPLNKVRRDAKLQHERLGNYKLLQQGLERAGLHRVMDIEGLIAGHFKPHYELAKWLNRLFEQDQLQAADSAPEPASSEPETEASPEQARQSRHPSGDPRTGPGFHQAHDNKAVERGAADRSDIHSVLLSIGTLCRLRKAENGEGAALAIEILQLLDSIQLEGRAGGDALAEK